MMLWTRPLWAPRGLPWPLRWDLWSRACVVVPTPGVRGCLALEPSLGFVVQAEGSLSSFLTDPTEPELGVALGPGQLTAGGHGCQKAFPSPLHGIKERQPHM